MESSGDGAPAARRGSYDDAAASLRPVSHRCRWVAMGDQGALFATAPPASALPPCVGFGFGEAEGERVRRVEAKVFGGEK